ncbi:hypothetical protein NEMBOFW57_001211 [Staphylotrichum longicolle]|uniref:Methyltransferase n=1 Tax=Staphylotrichum longicolle TaxID=669026 RepID=A0AAD4HXP4_9PEZI|nr:hypothetical protein NEMBOFW57_001211 [Staphylotrichum longicolle]
MAESAALDAQPKHHVTTTLNYWDDPGDGSRPTPIFIGKGRVTNKRPHLPHEFVVTDITGDESKYALDTHGFQYCRHQSSEKHFTNEQTIRTVYYEECRQLLQDVTGANASTSSTTSSGPHEADALLKRRYQIINIWRPIETILKDPIAVADANTVPDSDLVGADLVEDDFNGESWVVRHNFDHRWYFKHRMTPQDVLLIKCFDSETDLARRALHSAFEDPAYREEASRQSIEVRCLVFY